MEKAWFETWFDTSYYHILYKHRTSEEATLFTSNLLNKNILPKPNQTISLLDVACGKGRHSIALNQLGYSVTGIDLSKESIVLANKYSNNTLQFLVADMRQFELNQSFDIVLNAFTSFGYFNTEAEDIQVLESIKKHLKKTGVFIFDYLNVENVEIIKPKTEEKTIDSILFKTHRTVSDGYIVKTIEVHDGNNVRFFKEKVKCISMKRFKELFNLVGFEIIETFGNYNLEEFDNENSVRCIIIAKPC